jgi:hypothetical protein
MGWVRRPLVPELLAWVGLRTTFWAKSWLFSSSSPWTSSSRFLRHSVARWPFMMQYLHTSSWAASDFRPPLAPCFPPLFLLLPPPHQALEFEPEPSGDFMRANHSSSVRSSLPPVSLAVGSFLHYSTTCRCPTASSIDRESRSRKVSMEIMTCSSNLIIKMRLCDRTTSEMRSPSSRI